MEFNRTRPRVLLASFGVVGFTRVRPRCRWGYPRSLGLLACDVRVVGFIWGRWVHSRTPWVSLGSSGVVPFTSARPWNHWVYPESLVFTCAHSGGGRVHPGSLVSLARVLKVVGFICGRCVYPGAPWVSFG